MQLIRIEDLWVGDWLRLKKSGRVGKYAGTTGDGKLKITIGEKTVITTSGNVDTTDEPVVQKTNEVSNRPQIKESHKSNLRAVIDLHMKVLRPSSQHTRAERILDIQIEAARNFIENAIKSKTRKIEIIHGKGEGVLKSEIKHLLSLYDQIQFTFDCNGGGATEVWLEY